MLKFLERKIALQLLVFYALFVIPLLAGGAELYFFQRDASQQNAQQADLGIAQAVAGDASTYVQGSIATALNLAQSQAASQLDPTQLTPLLNAARQTHPEISQYNVYDAAGQVVVRSPVAPPSVTSAGDMNAELHLLQRAPNGYLLQDAVDQTTDRSVLAIIARITDARQRQVGAVVLVLTLQPLDGHLQNVLHDIAAHDEMRIWMIDTRGTLVAAAQPLAAHTNVLQHSSGLSNALRAKTGSTIATEQGRGWLYSFVPVAQTGWSVVISRPTDAAFATAISFQHSLLIALVMLLAGASVFWFVMHGWVVAPLSRLAQAATLIRPDQALKVTDHRLLVREKSRQDEIGRLVTAFSTMEEEIHELFRKSDAESFTRLQTLDALLRSMNEGVLLENPAGEVVYANPRFLQFVGMVGPEARQNAVQSQQLTARIDELLETPEVYREAVLHAEHSGSPHVMEFPLRGYYNQLGQVVHSRRMIRMRLFQVRDSEGQVIGRGKILLDVTLQNEAELVKKNLLAIVSHELRTPLTAIKGYATSLLETDIELDAQTQRDFLQRIVAEEDRMAELVTSLLEMSQLEAGTLKLSPDLCRLDTLIERSIEGVKSVKHEQMAISMTLPPEVPVIYLDRRRMEMVLRNLLENAQRYAGEQVRIEISVAYTQEPEESGVCLSLADNGRGLPEELIERIFERFYQVDGGRERRSSGVGLGLAICRGFVEAHGGRIWAANRSDGCTGALFHIWLPARLLHVPVARPQPSQLKIENIF